MSTGDLLLRVECYLAVRKALGYACRSEEKLLKNFVQFLERNGAPGPIRAQAALDWTCAPAHGPAPSGQVNRLRVVHGFLCHLQAFVFETEVPGPGVLPPMRRPLPYLGFFAYPRKKVQSRITPPARPRSRSGFPSTPKRFRPSP